MVATNGQQTASFTGRKQSRATGRVAALVIKRLKTFEPGVKHLEHLVDPTEFLDELKMS